MYENFSSLSYIHVCGSLKLSLVTLTCEKNDKKLKVVPYAKVFLFFSLPKITIVDLLSIVI